MIASNFARNARYSFLAVLMGAGMYVGMDAYAASHLEKSALSCGTEANPCQIDPLNVTAERGDVRFVDAEPAPEPARAMSMSARI